MHAVISKLRNFTIPRSITSNPLQTLEIHVFSDASEKAYAAAVYSKAVDSLQNVSEHLLMSKTKVAPVKTISMPRFELCGAHLAAKLTEAVLKILSVTKLIVRVIAWTDSTIVLQWLSQLPRTWTTFVAKRVSYIQEILPRSNWNHVPTADNPADLASRGATTDDLLQCSLWWQGPVWLQRDSLHWPKLDIQEKDVPERKQFKTVVSEHQTKIVLAAQSNKTSTILDITRFDSLDKLIRVTSYVMKFIRKLKKLDIESHSTVEPRCYDEARFYFLRKEQELYLPEEISYIRDGNARLAKQSKLYNLSPFFDSDFNVIRVGGRLGQSNYHEDKKFPVLDPKESHLVPLILKKSHGGGQLTLNSIREQNWIITAKPIVNSFIKKCITCFRFTYKPDYPMMADLPAERIAPVRAFSQTGIDFAGPFYVKDDGMKKTYISIFVCMTTKAVHLEIVGRLTKEHCILALKRFIARRGLPAKILSDNGSNFIGTRNELLKVQELLNREKQENSIINFINNQGIEWVTIPTKAPHFGGLWEAAVKSMKRHMRRVNGLQVLNYEELVTISTQIEAVPNSRPLYPMSNVPTDLSPLTPGHFLIGSPLLSLPERKTDDATPLPIRIQLIKKIQDDFW